MASSSHEHEVPRDDERGALYMAELCKQINDSGRSEVLSVLMSGALFHHVSTYVVTRDNQIFLQKGSVKINRSSRNRADQYQAFGGCNYASNILHRINSLRLELLDEAAFVPEQGAVWSPLCVYKDRDWSAGRQLKIPQIPAMERPPPPGSAWLLLAPPGSSWLLLARPGSSWLLLAPPGSSWLLLAPPGSSWLLLAPPGSSWLLLAPPGSSWLLLAAPGIP